MTPHCHKNWSALRRSFLQYYNGSRAWEFQLAAEQQMRERFIWGMMRCASCFDWLQTCKRSWRRMVLTSLFWRSSCQQRWQNSVSLLQAPHPESVDLKPNCSACLKLTVDVCDAVDPFHMKTHKGAFCFAHCTPESHSEIREKKTELQYCRATE